MMQLIKKLLFVCLVSLFVSVLYLTPAEAANRQGSHRVGGTNSHGKGSHYVGGHFIEQIDSLTTSKLRNYSMPSCTSPSLTKQLKCQEYLP